MEFQTSRQIQASKAMFPIDLAPWVVLRVQTVAMPMLDYPPPLSSAQPQE